MTNKISVRSVSVAAPIKIPCNARFDTFQVSETYLIDAKLVSTGVIAWHADSSNRAVIDRCYGLRTFPNVKKLLFIDH